MANPADPGTFDIWITDRMSFATAPPKADDTGDFEKWITDRIYWKDYVEAVVITGGDSLASLFKSRKQQHHLIVR